MKKSEFKTLFKPIIKECLNELLIEEGLKRIIEENKAPQKQIESSYEQQEKKHINSSIQEKRNKIEEMKQMMLKKNGGMFNPFEGVQVAEEELQLNENNDFEPMAHPGLAGTRGVDTSKLFSQNKGVWSAMINASKGKKE